MELRGIALGAFAVMVLPHLAEAAWGEAVDHLTVRACADTRCPAIGILRAGAQVWVGNSLGGWYQVASGGMNGYASARYIRVAAAQHYVPNAVYVLPYVPSPPVIVVSSYPQYVVPVQPFYGYAWPTSQRYWYEGRVRYFGATWHNSPGGLSNWFGH